MRITRSVAETRSSVIADRGALSPLGSYALGRILTHVRVWDESQWDAGVFLAAERLEGILDSFYSLGDDDRVRLALDVEYGRVIPSLQRSRFVLVEVPTMELVRPSSLHQPSGHDAFDPSEPVGMVSGTRRRRVVDGYHRVGSAQAMGLRTVQVVWAVP